MLLLVAFDVLVALVLTVTSHSAVTPLTSTVMVAVPSATAVTLPSAFTVATDSSLLAYVTVSARASSGASI